MHHQFAFDKVKAVRNRLERTHYHLLLQFRPEVWQIVQCLQRILSIRRSEWYLKLIGLYQMSLEVVLLHHKEIFDRFRADPEFECGPYSRELKELRSKVILYVSSRVLRLFPNFFFRLPDFKKNLIGICVPDPKADELDVVNVVLGSAQVLFSRFFESTYLLQSQGFAHYYYQFKSKCRQNQRRSTSLCKCKFSSLKFFISPSFDYNKFCILLLIYLILPSTSPCLSSKFFLSSSIS